MAGRSNPNFDRTALAIATLVNPSNQVSVGKDFDLEKFNIFNQSTYLYELCFIYVFVIVFRFQMIFLGYEK